MKRRLFTIWLAVVSSAATAHPVAFEGALGVMGYHQPDMTNWQVAYSVSSRFALGVDYFREAMGGPERHYLLSRVNWLVKRWNQTDAQANVYLSGGAGGLRLPGELRAVGLVAAEADYETRRYYVSAKASALVPDGRPVSPMYQARAGVAPYLGKFDGLNTWLIVQAQAFPRDSVEPVRVGPVLRFFYDNVLWELGATARGTWSLNFMIHF